MYDGRIVVLKGPAAALCYPDPVLRPASDVDILVDDPERAQEALIAAGFVRTGNFDDNYYDGLHHLRPLRDPSSAGAVVEVHRRPNWVDWAEPPSVEELLSVAVSEFPDLPGVTVLPPAHHAVAVAAHSWGESPFRRLLDMVDVAALVQGVEDEATRLADRWELSRLWRATSEAVGALFYGNEQPLSLRLWARDLGEVRDPTVAEGHARRLLSPFWSLPPHRAIAGALQHVGRSFTPAPNEDWSGKLTRIREAALHPTRRTTEHGRILGPGALQPRHKRR